MTAVLTIGVALIAWALVRWVEIAAHRNAWRVADQMAREDHAARMRRRAFCPRCGHAAHAAGAACPARAREASE